MDENWQETMKNFASGSGVSKDAQPKRRGSNSSIKSSCSSSKLALLPPVQTAYDSGNYTNSSNASDSGTTSETEQRTPDNNEHYRLLLREKEQALFLALQDVRKLRSELERLSKSEQWYKQELKVQKNTRLEALERLYTQERKYMQENQRLQRECMRLYERCGEMEWELEVQREKALQELERKGRNRDEKELYDTKDFEIEQQRALIDEQQQLIAVLRKQKRALIEDLKRLTGEKDEKVVELQQTLVSMEVENTRITTKCKQLLNERKTLEEQLQVHKSNVQMESNEKQKMQKLVIELREQIVAREQTLVHKECDIEELQQQLKTKLKHEADVDEVHRLSVAYHEEISAKSTEITTLKTTLVALQEELNLQADSQTQSEQQERQIEKLNGSLDERRFELQNLRQTDADKATQITELQHNIKRFSAERESALEQLHMAQKALKAVERELITLNENYANVCALCESTKFELEIREIEQGKLKFQTQSEQKEIAKLRDKLRDYLQQTSELSAKINALENQLQIRTQEKQKLVNQVKFMEQNLTEANERCHRTEQLLMENDADMCNLQMQLQRSEEIIEKLKEERQRENIAESIVESMYKFKEEREKSENWSETNARNEEDIEKLSMENQKLLENLDKQSELIAEKNKLLEALENVMKNHTTLHESKESQQEKLHTLTANMTELVKENIELKKILQENSEQQQMQKEITEREYECAMLKEKLAKECEAMQHLQQQLLTSDAALYKLQREQEREKEQQMIVKHITDFDELTKEHAILQQELLTLRAEKAAMEQELNEAKASLEMLTQSFRNLHEKEEASKEEYEIEIAQLRQELAATEERLESEASVLSFIKENAELYERIQKEIEKQKRTKEKCKNEELPAAEEQQQEIAERAENLQLEKAAAEVNNPLQANLLLSTLFHKNDEEELEKLRGKLQNLEAQLNSSVNADEAKREQRIELINSLLAQQNVRVDQLSQTQLAWEELLGALNATQALEEDHRKELELKRIELEELNELFAEQNEELHTLQAYSFHLETKRNEEYEQLKATFQQQLKVIEMSFSDKMVESEKQKTHDDLVNEVADSSDAKMRSMQSSIDRLLQERKEHTLQMQAMEKEINEYRKLKRAAIMVPELIGYKKQIHLLGNSSTVAAAAAVEEETEAAERDEIEMELSSTTSSVESSSCCSQRNDNDDRLRILTKVLEAEHCRKMKRYDLHIRTLLTNVKSLKKALKAAEQKSTIVHDMHAKNAMNLQELQLTRRHLEEMRLKYEQSQNTIKTLEHELEIERKKFESSDLGKSAQQQESTHEVANLIDDYKKLIQQSAVRTCRPKTSAILDLIQRSNQCVPNLDKLQTTVDVLRNDIQDLIVNYTQNMMLSTFGASTATNAAAAADVKMPSLMDELRAATENF